RSIHDQSLDTLTVAEAGTKGLIVTYPDELVSTAVLKMLKNDIGRLIVVDPHDQKRLVGYLGRPNIINARLQRHEEEHLREPGWLNNLPLLWRR
ncbi:MAG TPA: CBS domain-containing protein, partial [Bacteroidota bacterium]|nr:CBS domain-containing protein [Bacteroidota bacterium]